MKSLLPQLPLPISELQGWPWTEETDYQQYKAGINYPKISIITPSLNQGEFLEQSIRSVLLQNYPNLEYIIIDGGSTDDSLEIIKKYKPWLTYWVSEPDEGQANAINKGLQHCTGMVFNWLNSDDWYLPNVLESIGRTFVEQANLKVFCGQQIVQYANGTEILNRPSPIAKSLEATLALTHINQPATFFHLPILRTLFPLKEELNYLFDAEIWLRFLLKYRQDQIYRNKLIINYFRIHKNSKTSSQKEGFGREKFHLIRALALSCKAYEWMPNHVPSNKRLELDLQQGFRQAQRKEINSKGLNLNLLYRCFKERFGARDFDYCRKILRPLLFFRLYDFRFLLQKIRLLWH